LHARRLKTVAVIESNADGRLHYHAMIDRPCYFSFEKFKVVVTDQWLRTDFGYRQIAIQDAATAGWTDSSMAKYAIGDVVVKDKGGNRIVRAIFTTLAGELCYAVEHEGALDFVEEAKLSGSPKTDLAA
jgi:hypothetical protein